ncbi:hypothetical protein NBT05_12365 [Aquimarina sp. ERC-38]|uniref:hypothetical protein n=1 Tax=Aquimarina sp. ERC-38 TaxID=2949996 RepID=UPI00224789EE|nr:hypothetical protein [Aquimarina sp. ERC-38]UZO79742.1 hypothetical protein NBT05_12365 [Aquimarina sp. ERC-38]
MTPILVLSTLKNILSNRKVQIVLILLILYWLFKKKIGDFIRRQRQKKFDRNDGDTINQLVHQYRAMANPSGISWMQDFDGTSTSQLLSLAYQTRGKLDLVSKAYQLKFSETLNDRLRKELSASDFQRWNDIVN